MACVLAGSGLHVKIAHADEDAGAPPPSASSPSSDRADEAAAAKKRGDELMLGGQPAEALSAYSEA